MGARNFSGIYALTSEQVVTVGAPWLLENALAIPVRLGHPVSKNLPGAQSATYLPLSVDTNDSRGSLVWCSDKYGVAANPVHVDACASLNVVQMNVAVLGDQVHHVVLGPHLCCKNDSRYFTEGFVCVCVCAHVSEILKRSKFWPQKESGTIFLIKG